MNANSYTELSPNEKRNIKKHRHNLDAAQLSTRFNIHIDKVNRYLTWLDSCPWIQQKDNGLQIEINGIFNYNALPEGYSWVM